MYYAKEPPDIQGHNQDQFLQMATTIPRNIVCCCWPRLLQWSHWASLRPLRP